MVGPGVLSVFDCFSLRELPLTDWGRPGHPLAGPALRQPRGSGVRIGSRGSLHARRRIRHDNPAHLPHRSAPSEDLRYHGSDRTTVVMDALMVRTQIQLTEAQALALREAYER